MLKLLRYFLVLKLALTIMGMGYLYFTRTQRVEKFLSEKLNADVTIKDVKLRWKKIALQKIKVSNSQSPLFRADEVEIVLSPWQLCKKEVEVEKVKVQNPILGLMLFNKSGSENNWVSSMKEGSSSSKKFTINTLKIMNLRFEAQFASGKGVSLPVLSYVEIKDLGKSSSLTFREVEREIFANLIAKEPTLGLYFGQLPRDSGVVNDQSLMDEVKLKGRAIVNSFRSLF